MDVKNVVTRLCLHIPGYSVTCTRIVMIIVIDVVNSVSNSASLESTPIKNTYFNRPGI